jgi:hypothetical protein
MIFGGFFHTQETELYSSKRPYEFNAGGSGSDLLRTRVFLRDTHSQWILIAHAANSCPRTGTDVLERFHPVNLLKRNQSVSPLVKALFPSNFPKAQNRVEKYEGKPEDVLT